MEYIDIYDIITGIPNKDHDVWSFIKFQ